MLPHTGGLRRQSAGDNRGNLQPPQSGPVGVLFYLPLYPFPFPYLHSPMHRGGFCCFCFCFLGGVGVDGNTPLPECLLLHLAVTSCCYICFHHLLLHHKKSESGKRKTLCQNWLLSLLLYSVSRSSRAEPEVLCIGNLQRVNIDSYSGTENDIHVGQCHCIMQFACAPPFLQETYTHMNHSFKVFLPTL